MTRSQQAEASGIENLLEQAERRGMLILSLPGTATMVLSHGGRGDDALADTIVERAAEVEALTTRRWPSEEEAEAWALIKRDQRARHEPD